MAPPENHETLHCCVAFMCTGLYMQHTDVVIFSVAETWLTYKNVATFSPRFKTQVCCRNNYRGFINGSSGWSIRIGISSSQS